MATFPASSFWSKAVMCKLAQETFEDSQSVNKKGYFWVLRGFQLGISQYGKMIPNPLMGHEFPNVSPIMGFSCPNITLNWDFHVPTFPLNWDFHVPIFSLSWDFHVPIFPL